MSSPSTRLSALLLLSCALTGCGVDSTRSLWDSSWMGDPPEHRRALWESGKVCEYGAKGVLTPATATIDVVTDAEVWEGVLIVAWVGLEVASGGGCGERDSCGFHGHKGSRCRDHASRPVAMAAAGRSRVGVRALPQYQAAEARRHRRERA
jgi:hypothetical protein